MQIKDILRLKGSDVATISSDASVAELVAGLAEHRVGALVVSGSGQAVAGIVSERDVVRGLAQHGPGLLNQPVSAIMTTEVYTCEPGTSLVDMATEMTVRRFRHAPVLEDGRLVGIISIGDVVKKRIDQLKAERDHLEAYINT